MVSLPGGEIRPGRGPTTRSPPFWRSSTARFGIVGATAAGPALVLKSQPIVVAWAGSRPPAVSVCAARGKERLAQGREEAEKEPTSVETVAPRGPGSRDRAHGGHGNHAVGQLPAGPGRIR